MNGAILLDDDGKRKLDEDGKLMLDDGAGNNCPCGCGAPACPTDCSAIGNVTLALTLTPKVLNCCASRAAQTMTRSGCTWSFTDLHPGPGACQPVGGMLACSLVSGVETWTYSGTGCYGGMLATFQPTTPGDPRGTYTVTNGSVLCNVIGVVIS